MLHSTTVEHMCLIYGQVVRNWELSADAERGETMIMVVSQWGFVEFSTKWRECSLRSLSISRYPDRDKLCAVHTLWCVETTQIDLMLSKLWRQSPQEGKLPIVYLDP